MRAHVSNATYGLLDYAAYPAIMLAAAPVMLRHLGVAEYGIWLIANAAIGAGSIVSTGFGDAVIQRIARLRSSGDIAAIRRVVANVLTINLTLGAVLASLLFALIPYVTGRITNFDPALRTPCLWSLRIGAVLILLRSVESVFVSTQRAFEIYANAVRISIVTRLVTILLCVWLAVRGSGVPTMMLVTAAAVGCGAIAQWASTRRLGASQLMPGFDRSLWLELASFGSFTWLQAVSGVFFSQTDRLLLGVTLGASAVSYYGVCVQMAQPIHGLIAAGLHFIFPHLSRRFAISATTSMRRPVLRALVLNTLAAITLTGSLLLFGRPLLKHWMDVSFADRSSFTLSLLAIGSGLLAMNVTGHYALLAMGQVRLVTALNVAGGLAMLLAMILLVPTNGVQGAALARLCYGPITCLLYLPLFRLLGKTPELSIELAAVAAEEA